MSDPFAVTCDPAWYVPRPAADAALAGLEAALRGGRRCAVLSGPPGIGKTMLVRVLEARMEASATGVHLPYAALGFEDLCRWVLGILAGDEAAGTAASPSHELLAEIRVAADEGRGLLLFLDDASALPPDTARELLALCDQAAGALQLVVVPVDDGRAARVVAALGEDLHHVRLIEPMSLPETEAYLQARLARAEAPEAVVARFDAVTARRIWRESGGNPRLLHGFATAELRDVGFDPTAPIRQDAPAPALELDETSDREMGEDTGQTAEVA